METHKIKDSQMIRGTISDLYKKLNRKIIVYFFIIIMLFVVSLFIVNQHVANGLEQSSNKQILAASQEFNATLSEKLGIIASSDIFMEYLRAGSVTRKHILPDFLLELSLLKSPMFQGMKISALSGESIFEDGNTTGLKTLSLNLCYLNSQLNSSLGECRYRWTIFIDEEKYIKQFLLLNGDLSYCPTCKAQNLLNNKYFGIFSINNASKIMFKGVVNNATRSEIFQYFFLISIFFIIIYYCMKTQVGKIFNNNIKHPIQLLTQSIKSNQIEKYTEYSLEELQYLSDQLRLWHIEHKKTLQQQKNAEIGELAAQVAHDIRSPLATINVVVKESNELEEQKRIMLRNATQQLNDIANILLLKYRSKTDASLVENNPTKDPEVIAVLLDLIVSEKRLQYKHLPITIDFNVDLNARGAFAQIVVSDFKRLISNIINNAIEAVNGKGDIHIRLSKSKTRINIEISDNGIGMTPELVAKVFDGSITSSKKEGSGIGLVSAYQLIKSWSGELSITSKINVGTTLYLSFVLLESASWFSENLAFVENSKVVILDDDQSIHDLWESRFTNEISEAKLQLVHFYHAEELIHYDLSQLSSAYFLCDYELIGQDKTGLDVVEQLHLGTTATLVTSRYDDRDIRNRCAKIGVKILPKNYAAYVPINIRPALQGDLLLNYDHKNIDLVLVDNDPLVLSTWKLSARSKNKNILTFNNFEEAERAIQNFDRTIPIYIDSDLGTEIPGEEYAKILHEAGFTCIYLATGYEADSFEAMYWIKGIVGKSPVF